MNRHGHGYQYNGQDFTAVFTLTHAVGAPVTLVNTNSPLGLSDSYTVTVTPASGGPPTGTVTFFDNGSPFTVATLALPARSATATASIQIPRWDLQYHRDLQRFHELRGQQYDRGHEPDGDTGNTTTTLAVVSYPTTNPLETLVAHCGSGSTPIT